MRARRAAPDDLPFLVEMLAAAASWRAARPVDEVWEVPANRRYLEGWGRTGDVGVVAEDDVRPLGAAWCRLFTAGSHGYGFVSEEVPELSVGVVSDARRGGVGTTLLHALAVEARSLGFDALSLSVENDNPAKALYARLGYQEVVIDGSATTMLLHLTRMTPAVG